MRLAAIHIRLRRRVDQRIEIQSAERRSHLLRRAEIELRVIESDNVEVARIFAHQRRAKASAGADNDKSFHRRLR